MAPIPTIFTVPVGDKGTITCTEPSPKVYLLTFNTPPDNRLTLAFNEAFLTALDLIEQKLPKGVVVTTSGIQKFYSNGLDLAQVMSTPGFWGKSVYPMWRRLLSYPMPTVALINGHCFAGGMITAMMHDYRIMNPQKGFMCMNELDLGVPLRPPMSSIFRQKLRPDVYRAMIIEAKRFTGQEGLKDGLVDLLGGLDEGLKFIADFKLTAKAGSESYGPLKEEMWRETIGYLDDASTGTEDKWEAEKDRLREKISTEAAARVGKFEASQKGGKSKL